MAVNLVIDNDICAHPAVGFPSFPDNKGDWKNIRLERVSMDAHATEVPYEFRPVVDWGLFESFGTRLSQRLGREKSHGVINPLWRHVHVAAGAFE